MKKILSILLILLLALALFAAIILVPAHRQIRSVAPPLPSFGELATGLALSTAGSDTPIAISYLNTASQRSTQGTLGHPGVLIEWLDGRIFLIDTGMPVEEAIAFGKPLELLIDAQPTQTFGDLSEQLGQGVERIKGIAFTHLHNDHTDGLPAICNAQTQSATVFQTPLQHGELNHTTEMGFAAFEKAACVRQQLSDQTIKPIPGFPGLVAISLGGHTPGSTLYAARVADKYWLFSGDITNDKKSLLEDIPKYWFYSTFIVPEDTQRTAQLREYLLAMDSLDNVTVLPAHDVEVMAENLPQFAGGRSGSR